MSWPVLSVTTFLPLLGALFIMALRGEEEAEKRNARWIALWTTLITFAISLVDMRRKVISASRRIFIGVDLPKTRRKLRP